MKNSYADPTANTAIANVDRERRREEMRRKQLEQRRYARFIREIECSASQTPSVGRKEKR